MIIVKVNDSNVILYFDIYEYQKNQTYVVKCSNPKLLPDIPAEKIIINEEHSITNYHAKRLFSIHELNMYKKLNKYNITPKLFGYTELEGMKYILLEKMRPLTYYDIYSNIDKYIKQLIDKFLLMQSLGVVHGDLRKNNLLINDENELFICNFEDKGYSEPWAAPELLTGKITKPTLSSDVYSLGCTIWEMIIGEDPMDECR